MDISNILTNIEGYLSHNLDFNYGRLFFNPFDDSIDHALSLIITGWNFDDQFSFKSGYNLTMEYRKQLEPISTGEDPLIVFSREANEIDKLLYQPHGNWFSSGYYKINKLGTSDLFQDSRKRIYIHADYKINIVN